MFNLVKQIVEFQGNSYIINRLIKESDIPQENVNDYKEYLKCDTVLKKDGIYYFVNKIEEAQVIEDSPLELDKSTNN